MSEQPRKFRVSLWFLKGEQDAKAADEAAQSGDALAMDAADLMPIEDRYLDDGTHRKSLTHIFSLRTGKTDYIQQVAHDPSGGTTLNEKAIIGDLKLGGRRMAAAIGAAALVLGGVVAYFVI